MSRLQKHVLVTDTAHQYLIDGLREYYKVVYKPAIDYEEVCHSIGKYSGLVINSKIKVDHSFLERATNLEWIGRLGSGLDVIDLIETKRRNIHVINSPEGNANAVGEHALGMLLTLFNKIIAGNEMVRSLSPWNREQMRGVEIDGLTVGIIGCGHTGSAFVKKLSGFDVQILIYDKYKKRIPAIHRFQHETNLAELLQRADIVSFHLPLTKETNGWIDGSFLDQMKPGATLINTSRGKILNLDHLCARLENGSISGACLDVFENEKPRKYSSDELNTMKRLSRMNQVVLTPHVAGWTKESKKKIAEILLKKIIYVAEGPKL